MAVLTAEIVTLFQDIFEHANIKVPPALDRILQVFLISPSMHRIHHSTLITDQNRNFGTIVPWWDRLFGTFAPSATTEFETGLQGYPKEHSASLVHTLKMPFNKVE